MSEKKILVLSRNVHLEAVRVAAGLTIAGHTVRLIFLGAPLPEDSINPEHFELLELSDIEPETINKKMGKEFKLIESSELIHSLEHSDHVINI